jgi:hypothetical protein
MLSDKIRHFLSESEGQLYFADSSLEANGEWHSLDQALQFVMFGDLIRKFFQTGNLVHSSVKFYQIGSCHQEVFNKLLLKRDDLQGSQLISRYDLFPRLKAYDFDLEKEMNFIYAGRLSYQKNLPFLLYFLSACIKEGLNIKAHLYGEYDNQFHEHLGRRNCPPLKQVLEKIIEEEELKDKVFFRGHVDSNAWPETSVDQPVAVSMSTFVGEDFGVSLAQAQQKGWPILCSNFGGHQDIEGEAVSFIPAWWVGNSHLPLAVQKVLAEKVASEFSKLGFTDIKKELLEEDLTLSLTLNELDEARRKLSLELGHSSQWLNLEGLDVFADLDRGATFLRSVFDLLEGPKKETAKEVSIIFSEAERDELSDEATEWLKECLDELKLEDKIRFIFESDLNSGDSLILLKRSDKAHCSKAVGPKASDFIKKLFG